MTSDIVPVAKYVVIDGIDGGGKGTIFKRIEKEFPRPPSEMGYGKILMEGPVGKYSIITREPGGTPLAEKLRGMILSDVMSSFSEFCLFLGQRDDGRKQVVHPALAGGVNVISDRSDSATFAYQLRGRQLDHLEDLYWKTRPMMAPLPSLYVFLDLDPLVAAQRMTGRGNEADNFEKQNTEFFERVRNGFKEFAQKVEAPCRFVNAEQGKDEVAEDVLKILREHLGVAPKVEANIFPLERRA